MLGRFLFGLDPEGLAEFCKGYEEELASREDPWPVECRLLGMAKLLNGDLLGASNRLHEAVITSHRPDPIALACLGMLYGRLGNKRHASTG